MPENVESHAACRGAKIMVALAVRHATMAWMLPGVGYCKNTLTTPRTAPPAPCGTKGGMGRASFHNRMR